MKFSFAAYTTILLMTLQHAANAGCPFRFYNNGCELTTDISPPVPASDSVMYYAEGGVQWRHCCNLELVRRIK
jgi:hypothetical protein